MAETFSLIERAGLFWDKSHFTEAQAGLCPMSLGALFEKLEC